MDSCYTRSLVLQFSAAGLSLMSEYEDEENYYFDAFKK